MDKIIFLGNSFKTMKPIKGIEKCKKLGELLTKV